MAFFNLQATALRCRVGNQLHKQTNPLVGTRGSRVRLCTKIEAFKISTTSRGNPRRVARTFAGGANFFWKDFLRVVWKGPQAVESGSWVRYGRVAQKPKLR
jgi:hypothetical protein